jgi:glyoxylase-like metal-dependent hydrolase (beta-lactamase superfamily II)
MTIQYQNQNLTVFESALYRTTTTVLDLESAWLLVDPNWLPQEIEAIKNFIQNKDALRQIYILFTHSDFDHILGYGAFPNARVIAHKDFVEHPFKEKMIQQIHDFDDSFYISRPYRIQYPHVDVVIDHEGQTLQVGNQDVVFYSAKGHVRDGIMAFLPNNGICIAGDYLSNIEIPWVEYSFKEYQQTLRRFDEKVRQYDIQTLIPGHGDVAVSRNEITERIRLDTRYISGFLKGFKADSQFFEPFLSSRGFALQNRNIHDMNTAFCQSGDVFL